MIDNNHDACIDQLNIMLLIGMKSNFTTYPMPPMMANPIAHEVAIFLNSATSGFSHALKKCSLSLANF